MDKIKINNMKVFAYHGVSEKEKSNGQIFEIDIEIHSDLSKAVVNDEILNTIDYSYIFKIIEKEFCKKKYNLLETVAEKISDRLLEIKLIKSLILNIRKPDAPIIGNFDSVEIEIERKNTC